MARGKRAGTGKAGKADAAPAASDQSPTGPGGLPLPSPVAATNLVIADIVLRAAGGLLRDRMEKSGKYRVVMTRTDDTFIALADRVKIARNEGASLFNPISWFSKVRLDRFFTVLK